MTKDSIYRAAYNRRKKLINTGYQYKENILKKTISKQMYGVNETLDTFLKNVNEIVYENIEAVKTIKVFANPALDKYERDIK
jgi:hypothetical protein